MKKLTDYNYKDLKVAFESSVSIAEALGKIGLKVNNGSYHQIRKIASHYNLELPKWDNKKATRQATARNTLSTEEYFRTGILRNGSNVKDRLVKLGWKYACFMADCELGGKTSWSGKKLTFQVDHISGDRFDNRLENLRFLCPNCHTQTETFCNNKGNVNYSYCICGRRMQGTPKKTCIHSTDGTWDNLLCDDCNNPRSKGSARCFKCNLAYRSAKGLDIKIAWPETQEIISNIEKIGYLQYSSILNVSDNGIRKHLTKAGVRPLPKKLNKKEREKLAFEAKSVRIILLDKNTN